MDGFEPPISCFQGRQGRPGSPTRWCEQGRFGRSDHRAVRTRQPKRNPALQDWSTRQDSNLHLPGPNQSFIQLSYVCDDGAATETRTPVCRLRAGCPATNVCVVGSPTRTRTWIDRLTTGRPAVGRSGNGGAPRTRTELNLLAREIRGPCACPELVALRGQTLGSACTERGEKGLTPRIEDIGAWGRFRAHLSAASTRRFHQISFPGELRLVRPTGIEPVSARWHRAALPLSYGRWVRGSCSGGSAPLPTET